MTRLSPHFTLEEMLVTQVRGVDNTPPKYALEALQDTAMRMEEVRQVLQSHSIIVTSGFRSPLVNKVVGGSTNSAHMHGLACDFICPAFGRPIDIARAIVNSSVKFDQLIEEGSWVHLSFDPKMRRNILSKSPTGGLIAGLPQVAT